jgi:DUF438 domain-containing protein
MSLAESPPGERHAGPAARARTAVLEQHAELRRLLKMAMAEAHAAIKRQAVLHEPLRTLMATVRDVFVRHLAEEEALILPLLEGNLARGPLRAARLREEHAEQRRELETLCTWPEEDDDLELALRFEALATALLEDIHREERDLLTPEIISDAGAAVAQSGG